MPVAEATPITFSERLLALLERVARNWIETRFSALIPLPKIDNNVVTTPILRHRGSSPLCRVDTQNPVADLSCFGAGAVSPTTLNHFPAFRHNQAARWS
jgi:hypothetical protein